MNSAMRPIFNEKVTEKWNLWDHSRLTWSNSAVETQGKTQT